jgi:alcohol dehydrogenase class IV
LLGIPANLTELGVTDPDLDWLVDSALKDPSVGGNPVEMNIENTRALFEACL